MANTIYSYPNNPRVYKVLICSKYSGVNVDVAPNFQLGVTNKTQEFLAKFPFGKVPVLDTRDGPIFESNAMALYVASSGGNHTLIGQTPYEMSLVQQYVNVADNEISPAAATWIYPLFGYVQYNEANTKKAQEDIFKTLEILNNILSDRTYFVGHDITLADICIFCSLYHLFQMALDPTTRSSYKNVTRWFMTCAEQPEFKAVVGPFTLCEKAQVYDPSVASKTCHVFENSCGSCDQSKVDTSCSTAPKNDEEEDDEPKEEPKPKNPMDLLPKSSFVLDQWKKHYSNSKDMAKAAEYFWENYDSEGYSMYRFEYKYNTELGQVFMSSNLVGGFFQRLDDLRKYAFGTLCVFGVNDNNAIYGMFIIRGSEIPDLLKEVVDYDSYNITKVNTSELEVRAEWNDIIAWTTKYQGMDLADGKTFK